MRNLFWKLFIALAICLAALYLLNPFGTATFDPRARLVGIAPFQIPAQSMAPTLVKGDFILASAWSYAWTEPKRGDVVVFKHPKMQGVNYVKRVAGLPGDKVELKDGHLFVNGKAIQEPYLDGQVMNHPQIAWMNERKIPPGEFFMLGDNRDNSNDSRFWGNVPRENLIGQVSRILYAEDQQRIGKVD